MFECINVCPSTTCLKMMLKYIESHGKLALVVNQRNPTEAIFLTSLMRDDVIYIVRAYVITQTCNYFKTEVKFRR